MTTRARIGAWMGKALAPGPEPTGRADRLDGVDALVFERRLCSTPSRAWTLLTAPDIVAAWLGRWRFDPATRTAEVWGLADGEDAEPVRYLLQDLVPGRSVEVVTPGQAEAAPWRIRLDLVPEDGGTLLRLLETVPDPSFAPLMGAAADFYLDRLLAVDREGDQAARSSALSYDDYVVGQAQHYRDLLPLQRRPEGSTPR